MQVFYSFIVGMYSGPIYARIVPTEVVPFSILSVTFYSILELCDSVRQ